VLRRSGPDWHRSARAEHNTSEQPDEHGHAVFVDDRLHHGLCHHAGKSAAGRDRQQCNLVSASPPDEQGQPTRRHPGESEPDQADSTGAQQQIEYEVVGDVIADDDILTNVVMIERGPHTVPEHRTVSNERQSFGPLVEAGLN